MELTKEQEKIFRKCRKEAWKHFGITSGDGLVLHHVDETLRHNNIDRYIQWLPEDLVVMTKAEHTRLHKTGKPSGMLGKKETEEHKAKISAACKGLNGKRVICVETGIIYNTLAEINELLNIPQSNICYCCQGKRKTAGGYHWMYVD